MPEDGKKAPFLGTGLALETGDDLASGFDRRGFYISPREYGLDLSQGV
jgi:hypothetical protein